MKVWVAATLAATGLIAAAPQARADNSSYIDYLQKDTYLVSKHSSQQLGLLHERVTVSVTRPDGPVWS